MNKIVDFALLIFRFLPTFLREESPVLKSFLNAMLSPLKTLNGELVVFTEQVEKETRYNTQSLAFSAVIKQAFNVSAVEIENDFNPVVSVDVSSLVIDPTLPVVGSLQLQNGFDVGSLANLTPSVFFNFEVHVPTGFDRDNELQAFVNKYKVYGTTFQIIKDL